MNSVIWPEKRFPVTSTALMLMTWVRLSFDEKYAICGLYEHGDQGNGSDKTMAHKKVG